MRQGARRHICHRQKQQKTPEKFSYLFLFTTPALSACVGLCCVPFLNLILSVREGGGGSLPVVTLETSLCFPVWESESVVARSWPDASRSSKHCCLSAIMQNLSLGGRDAAILEKSVLDESPCGKGHPERMQDPNNDFVFFDLEVDSVPGEEIMLNLTFDPFKKFLVHCNYILCH